MRWRRQIFTRCARSSIWRRQAVGKAQLREMMVKWLEVGCLSMQ